MRAAEYLRQIQKFDCIIRKKLEKKEQWMAAATSISSNQSGERVQSSGTKDKMADAVINAVDIEKQIAEDIKRLVKKRDEVLNTLEHLDVVEYELLYKVYVEGVPLKECAGYFCKSYSWVTHIHRKALKNVQKILDGRGV